MHIVHVNTMDRAGGAERVALTLSRAYQQRGHRSSFLVGYKRGEDPSAVVVPLRNAGDRGVGWERLWLGAGDLVSTMIGQVRGAKKARTLMRLLARPRLLLEFERGYEDFDFPGSWRLLDLVDGQPDILHCHNLHGGYFDLRTLPRLSHGVRTVLTLHDMWLLSGHCSYSFDCERWETGCGSCPDLSIYPAIRRDATAHNLRRKGLIYQQSRLHVATPSHWLMSKVERSVLASGIAGSRVIPNGVDLAVFHPGDRQEARATLGLPPSARVVLHVGYRTHSNARRDFGALREAVKIAADRAPDQQITLICVGEERNPEHAGRAELRFIGYQNDQQVVAQYYRASDIYLHAAKADTFPTVVLESLACGTPVVATAVGGIPEQVTDGATGFLVPPTDSQSMSEAIFKLLTDEPNRLRMGRRAAHDARKRFGLDRQVEAYLTWYEELLAADEVMPEHQRAHWSRKSAHEQP